MAATLKKWKITFIISAVVSICFSIAVIIMAAVRNDYLFDLLETYPGALGVDLDGDGDNDGHSLYFGHDLNIAFGSFTLALSICCLIYSIKFIGRHHRIQAIFIFSYIISSAMLCASGLLVLWSTNGGNGKDEHRWYKEHNELVWKHSSAWDWMTQSYYYEYDDLWRELQVEYQCCGVRGSYEMGAVRALWNNKTDIFSTFEFPLECCKLDTKNNPENAFKCRKEENINTEGCWDAAVWPEFVPLAIVALVLSCLSIITTVYQTYFYIFNLKPLYHCC